MVMQLDHTVINVRYEMDRAEPQFTSLGFTLTPRGYHSLGSINHLMMFDTDYLELIGVPADAGSTRPDIVNGAIGFNGLVFKTEDADETFARLKALGMDGNPAKAFFRPVALADGDQNAHFRTTHVRADVFDAGRVYFCEHATPELVWRDQWQHHANRARHINAYVIVAKEPRRQAERYAQLVNADDPSGDDGGLTVTLQGGELWVLSEARYRERYGDLALPGDARASRFAALVLASEDLSATASVIDKVPGDDPRSISDTSVCIQVPAFNTLLEFQ